MVPVDLTWRLPSLAILKRSAAGERLLYGTEAGSWMTTVLAAAVTVSVMALASTVPARRAVGLQPTVALRAE